MKAKTKLLDLLKRGHDEERAYVSSLGKEERSAVGAPDQWSAKDVVAHNAIWKQREAHGFSAARRGENPPKYDDFDLANAEIFEAYRTSSWAEVLELSDRAQAELVEQTQELSDEDLVDPQKSPWQDERPPWRRIAGSGYIHPLMHLAYLYVERGDSEFATQMLEAAVQLLTGLDDSPEWCGLTIYNLACHYALSGHRERAIGKLREALQLNPALTDWSQEDPDFASIREDPNYQSLYSS